MAVKRNPALLLPMVSGCRVPRVQRLGHSPSIAADRAEAFVMAAFVEADYQKAHELFKWHESGDQSLEKLRGEVSCVSRASGGLFNGNERARMPQFGDALEAEPISARRFHSRGGLRGARLADWSGRRGANEEAKHDGHFS